MTYKEKLMSMPIEELINKTSSLEKQMMDDELMLRTIQERIYTNRMILNMNQSALARRYFEVIDFKKEKEIKET